MNRVILINSFEVAAGKEDEFMAGWQAAAAHLRHQDGFISTRLHQSLDPAAPFRFVNVAEWESPDHFRRAVSTPEFQELTRDMPFPNHPALYRVIHE